jgi:hypothetical protein
MDYSCCGDAIGVRAIGTVPEDGAAAGVWVWFVVVQALTVSSSKSDFGVYGVGALGRDDLHPGHDAGLDEGTQRFQLERNLWAHTGRSLPSSR